MADEREVQAWFAEVKAEQKVIDTSAVNVKRQQRTPMNDYSQLADEIFVAVKSYLDKALASLQTAQRALEQKMAVVLEQEAVERRMAAKLTVAAAEQGVQPRPWKFIVHRDANGFMTEVDAFPQ